MQKGDSSGTLEGEDSSSSVLVDRQCRVPPNMPVQKYERDLVIQSQMMTQRSDFFIPLTKGRGALERSETPGTARQQICPGGCPLLSIQSAVYRGGSLSGYDIREPGLPSNEEGWSL